MPEVGPDVAADEEPELATLEKKGWIWCGCEFVLDWLTVIGPDNVVTADSDRQGSGRGLAGFRWVLT